MKKLLFVLVSLVLVFGLSACKTEKENVVFNWNIGKEPASLDPTLNGDRAGGDVINQTFEGLVREINGIVYPGIAESWETSADGLTVTFHLRESNWSDGTPLTADDFVYSWLHGMDPLSASEYSWIWEYTNVVGAEDFVYSDGTAAQVGITAVDDLTFEVELINPTSYLVSLMAFFHFMPVKQEAVEAGADGIWAKDPDLYVSNGPFVLTEYTVGEGLKLVKNEEYWNKAEVGIDVINGKFIDDASTAYAAYNAGDLDFIPSVPTAEVPILIAESDEFYVFPLLGTYYYSFNMDTDEDGDNDADDGVWSSKKLRQALSYSIDREEITDVLGAGQVPAGGFIPPGFLDDEGNDFFETAGTYGLATDDSNYADAVKLFKEAATEMGLTVAELQAMLEQEEISYFSYSTHTLIIEMVQEMWETNLGFTIPLNEVIPIIPNLGIKADFNGWLTDFMDPFGLLSIFDSDHAYNDPNYYNAAFDTLLSEAQATTDMAVHFDKLYDAYEMFMTDMPVIPIYHYVDTMLAKSYLVDWGRSVLGSVDFSRASIDKEE